MMTLGPIGFLAPWLLTALAALPLIWWLLRFTPPRPKLVVFPPTRLLKGLEDSEQTAEHSPWWLTLLRVILAALIILALARPVVHPDREQLTGTGPLLVIVDNGWASATHWDARQTMLSAMIERAERGARAILIVPTAGAQNETLAPMSPEKAREAAAGLAPLPFDPSRDAAATRLTRELKDPAGYSIVWLSDGIDYGNAAEFAATLARLAGPDDQVTLARSSEQDVPLGLYAGIGDGGALTARVIRPGGGPQAGTLQAYSSRGERLAETALTFAPGKRATKAAFDLPLEIRNQVARIEIAGETSAGAVHLLDRRSQWRRVGIISGEAREFAQPLLSPLYYVERALTPYAEIAAARTSNVTAAVQELLERNLAVLVMADIGKLVPGTLKDIDGWVQRGGTLIRFAGPRLEKSGDALLPVPLRRGGRTLGGSLSWSEPQPLAPFDRESPFHGVAPSPEVKVHRQVLADPAQQISAEVWARLKDGTPLVSASRKGDGRLVLFHITANLDWSNLPISGLFVGMLRKIVERSVMTSGPSVTGAARAAASAEPTDAPGVLAPLQLLDGFGRLTTPTTAVQPLKNSELDTVQAGPANPPGYYGPAGAARALNVIAADTKLTPLSDLPVKTTAIGYQVQQATQLKPWLLAAALMAFLIDVLAVLLLAAGAGLPSLVRRGAAVVLLAGVATLAAPADIRAQQTDPAADKLALEASLRTRLAYVITGDNEIDRTSLAGLIGLGKVLNARTAIEPGPPIGVNVDSSELAFFPLLYWPVREDAQVLPEATLARIDAYMKQGGMILFDTRDYQQALPSGGGSNRGPGAQALARLLGKLDIPPLEPVPEQHVLTKSFYLLRNFPGRWDGGTLWVEARPDSDNARERQARQADGVSSLLITSNDFAAAWALDQDNRPMFPVVPGGDVQREMAFRVGVNIMMYALTGNYKADQVHLPALLERLGQ